MNKEVSKLIEESHKNYLSYEERIVQLEIKEKQLSSKISSVETERDELTIKIAEKDAAIRQAEKINSDLKI